MTMELQSGVTMIDPQDVDRIVRQASDEGALLYVIDTTQGVNRRSFFNTVRKNLPLDPPLAGDRSWEALADSLWSGLDSADSAVIVIVWKGSADMRNVAPCDFRTAVSIFSDLALSLANPEVTLSSSKKICVYIS